MPPQIGLKQFRIGADSRSSMCLSYCFYDPSTHEAILIDSHLELLDDYTAFLAEKSLKLVNAIDTQTHCCHSSAQQVLCERFRLPLPVLKDGETLNVGELKIQILFSPGVAGEAWILFNEQLAFTGNTLWIGSCAPQGLAGSDAQKHWESLQRLVTTLESRKNPDLLILPAFDSNHLLFSTLSMEEVKNQALLKKSLKEFQNWSSERAIVVAPGAKISHLDSVFKLSGLMEDFKANSSPLSAIAVEKYSHKLREKRPDDAFVDVREHSEFAEGHIAGTTNWPMVEVGFHLSELRLKKRIYVSCLSGMRSDVVSRTLAYLDFPDVVNVSGGFKAWQHAGLSVQTS